MPVAVAVHVGAALARPRASAGIEHVEQLAIVRAVHHGHILADRPNGGAGGRVYRDCEPRCT